MIKKPRTIALGTVAIAAGIALFATGPVVGQVWSQAASAQLPSNARPPCNGCMNALIVNKAILLFGVNLPFGRESPTFIQNVTQLAKMGFYSPQNAMLFARDFVMFFVAALAYLHAEEG